MKVATGTVVRGQIVADAMNFVDGTTVFIVSRDATERPRLAKDELAELEAGIAEADRGELLPGDSFLEELREFG